MKGNIHQEEVKIEPEVEDKDEEKEVPAPDESSESSPDESTEEESKEESKEEESEEEVVEEPLKNGLKEVEGETPRERALRAEVTRLKRKDRKEQQQEMLAPEKEEPQEDAYKDLRDIYTDEELVNIEKAVGHVVKNLGYVKKDEIYSQTGNQILTDFISEHPEYKPENDIDDLHWNTFQEIQSSDYNLKGKSPGQLKRIFEKIHRDVLEELGETSNIVDNSAKRLAEKSKLQSVSHSGGTKSKSSKKSDAPTDPKVRAMFKGGDWDELWNE